MFACVFKVGFEIGLVEANLAYLLLQLDANGVLFLHAVDLVEDDKGHELEWDLLALELEVAVTGLVLDGVVAKGEDGGWAIVRVAADGPIGETNDPCIDLVAIAPCEDRTGFRAAYVDAEDTESTD